MPCGCLGKKVIYNSLINFTLPSQQNNQQYQPRPHQPIPRQRVTWETIQKDLRRSK